MNIEQLYSLFLKSNNIQIDTRKVQKNDLFFGLTGTINGSKFAQKAIENGALAAIIDDKNYENQKNNIFYVENSLETLQELAKFHRNKLSIPVFALTGSNGKTTTKELITCVLKQKFNVQSTFGNLNNHIGVPLTLLSIKENHDFAVIEMGANHQKEIEFLCQIAKPDFGYITNLGKAHLDGFGGIEGVIKGKSEMYDFLINNNKIALINSDDSIQMEKSKNIKSIFFGSNSNEYKFELINKNNLIGLKYKNIEINSKLTGIYNFNNLSAAIRLGIYFDIPIEKIKNAIENYTPENHRSQIILKNNHTIIMDSYNANPTSMKVAIENFILFKGTKTLIIGDMFELGKEAEFEHKQIIKLVENNNFEQAIFVGNYFYKLRNNNNLYLEKTEDLINFLSENKIQNGNILIKGSRGMKLETILNLI